MYNILIFGDSIAGGRKIEKVKSWPLLLTQDIDKKDKDFTLVHNLSIPGQSTKELLKRFPIEAASRCKKISPDDLSSIIFAIGINDAKCTGSGENFVTSQENFKRNLQILIENAQKYTNHIIFIGLTPVDERKTAPIDNVYFLNENIRNYEKIIEEKCKENNIVFLSIIEGWLAFNYLDLLSNDGIHPNEVGHQKIFEKIQPLFI